MLEEAAPIRTLYNYKFTKKIGKGSYGEVWLTTYTDNKKYVVKKIRLKSAPLRERQAAQQECRLLAQLNHPNIVTFKDSFEAEGYLYIAMGYCEGGDLHMKLRDRQGQLLEERQIGEWLVQITMALQYLHQRNILHRDLKTQNIFLTRTHLIKLGDLGISRVLNNSEDLATTVIGTPYYMSPELFSNKPYNHKSDIWALGCCTFEMASLKHAFNAQNFNSLSFKILAGRIPDIPNKYSDDLNQLVHKMMHPNPDMRPSVSNILRHSYIRNHIKNFLKITESKSAAHRQRSSNRSSADRSQADSSRERQSLPPPTPPVPEVLPRPAVRSAKAAISSSNQPEARRLPPTVSKHSTPVPVSEKINANVKCTELELTILSKAPAKSVSEQSSPETVGSPKLLPHNQSAPQLNTSNNSSRQERLNSKARIRRRELKQMGAEAAAPSPSGDVTEPPKNVLGVSPVVYRLRRQFDLTPLKELIRLQQFMKPHKLIPHHHSHPGLTHASLLTPTSQSALPELCRPSSSHSRSVSDKGAAKASTGHESSSGEDVAKKLASSDESPTSSQQRNERASDEQELQTFIQQMNATLKMNKAVEKSPRKAPSNEEDPDHGPTEKANETVSRTERFNRNMVQIRKECYQKLGYDKIRDAFNALTKVEEEEHEVNLRNILGGQYDAFVGKIYQLKLWEDNLCGPAAK